MPVLPLLEEQGCNIIIVATATPSYVNNFVKHVGFKLTGAVVFDAERRTHQVCGLQTSVSASLVTPFRKHLRTFGRRALREGLVVSLKNATKGHGSSWQQGGTFLLSHTGSEEPKCTLAWREEYPGDWKPIQDILLEGLGVESPPVSFPERLDFVIKARSGSSSSCCCCPRRSAQTKVET